jgi:hypothetical protein
MKIIKQFDDPEYFSRIFRRNPGPNEYYKWGLGDDGLIYYSDTVGYTSSPNNWDLICRPGCTLMIKDMRLIIKEFGHLLVFI